MSSCRAEINFGHLGIWNAGKNLDTGATALQHNALATLAGRYIAFCPYNVVVCQNFEGQAGNTQDALKGKADSLNSLLLRRLRTGPQNLENRCTCFFPLLFSDALCMYCYCKTKGEVLRKKLSRKAAIGNCHTDGFRAPAAAAPASSGLLAVELSHVPALPHCTVSCRFPNTLRLLAPTPTSSMGQASTQQHYRHSKTIGPNFQSRIMLTSRSWGNAVVAGRERDAKFCPYHMVTR